MSKIVTVDSLPDLPYDAISGSCVAYDRRPMFTRIYFLVPTSSSTANFYVIDAVAGTIDKLTPPTFTISTSIGPGTAMCYDETQGRVWLFNSQYTSYYGYEWASWQYYDVENDTWIACDVSTLGLGSSWGVDAALVHTDGDICVGRPIGGQPADDHIYLCGNGSKTLYRYSISSNTWTALLGIGGARRGDPGEGSNLIWNEWNNDQILSWRGGGTSLLDIYTISTDTWGDEVVPNPPLVCDVGFESASMHKNGSTSLLASGGVVYTYDHTAHRISPLATIFGPDGAPHLGNGLFYYSTGAVTGMHVGIRIHGSNRVQSIKLDM